MTPDPIPLSAGLNQNFQLFRAEDKVLLVDMTGYDLATATALSWWVARSPYSIDDLSEVFIKKDKTAGIAVKNGTYIEIVIDGADTAAMQPELYYHELKISLADGSLKVAMSGNIVLRMSLQMEEVIP